jgi:hypothetical protein
VTTPAKTPRIASPHAFPPRLRGPVGRLMAAAMEVACPPEVRERLRRAGEGDLPEEQADALGAELDLLAGLLAGR